MELQLETAKAEVDKPFEKEAELNAKLERLTELNAELNMDQREENAADMEDEVTENREDPEGHVENEPELCRMADLKESEPTQKYHAERSKDDRPSLLAKMEILKGRVKGHQPAEKETKTRETAL